jgi:hypothetical protein
MPVSGITLMLDQVRRAIGRSVESGDVSEKEAMSALVEEADGWKMRLEELEAGGDE